MYNSGIISIFHSVFVILPISYIDITSFLIMIHVIEDVNGTCTKCFVFKHVELLSVHFSSYTQIINFHLSHVNMLFLCSNVFN